jgi:hypothetical protein
MSNTGAPAALRGYRLQALYILDRILDPQVRDSIVFHPEGGEDLDIWEGTERLQEVVQVKSYPSLTLSDLSSNEDNSFFKRIVQYIHQVDTPTVRLINFGTIGPELLKAWKGNQKQRDSVAKKLRLSGFSETDIQAIFTHIQIISVDETEMRERIAARLKDMISGIHPNSAFDLLTMWLYLVSERRISITRQDLIQRLTVDSRALSEQFAYHQEWFTSIVPFEEIEFDQEQLVKLGKEFYMGVSTRYEHVLADLDFRRERKLDEIKKAFEQSKVVIIHAASGQGKTTIAYRYLREAYPTHWRFRIELIKDRQHVLSIVRALSGFANMMQNPIAVYIDVSPRDTDWPDLVQRLATYPYLHVLVTIREEDLQRANISGADFFYSSVQLEFDELEAREIFVRAPSQFSQRFLDFDEAWKKFYQGGPLLEFVYLLTQTSTLRDRLQTQINRIRDEVQGNKRPADEIQLLRLVALASSFESRIHLPSLVKGLSLPDPTRTLELLEHEYLIRRSPDGFFIEGLHPVRSRIMLDILIDAVLAPWRDTAIQVLPLLNEDDLENFLLHIVIEQPTDSAIVLDKAQQHPWSSWTAIAAVLRVLQWVDIHAYIDEHIPLFREAYEEFRQAWWLVLNLDVAGVAGDVTNDFLDVFGHTIPFERRERMKAIQSRQASKENIFQRTRTWLHSLPVITHPPSSVKEWASLAELWFWLARFDIPQREKYTVPNDVLDSVVTELDLSLLADISLALYTFDPIFHADWIERHKTTLYSRLAYEYQIIALEENERMLKIHFLLSEELNNKTKSQGSERVKSKTIHEHTIRRISFIRRLFPTYESYGSQGYGHNFGSMISLPVDETHKEGVKVEAFHPHWLLRLNIIAHGLGRLLFRTTTWEEYVSLIISIRQKIVTSLSQLSNALRKYHQQTKNGKSDIFDKTIDSPLWMECRDATANLPLLPKSAVDAWGYAGESQSETINRQSEHSVLVPHALAMQKYHPYHKSEDYYKSINNFFQQALDIMVTNVTTAHLSIQEREIMYQFLEKKGVQTNAAHLTVYNLADAQSKLSNYQYQFRDLFAHILKSEDHLRDLEEQERLILNELWPLWYFFAFEPQQRWVNPQSQIPAQVRSAQKQLRNYFYQAIKQVNQLNVHVEILDNIGTWEGIPVYWLTLNVHSPTELYLQFEKLLLALQEAIGTVSYQELLSYVISTECEYVVVVPLIAGRALNQTAWRLSTRTTILEPLNADPENRWKYIQQPIPHENWSRLNLEIWNDPDISLANQLSLAIGEMLVRVSMLAALETSLELTDPGAEVAQQYADNQSQNLSRSYQLALDTLKEMSEKYLALSEEEAMSRFSLITAVEYISDLAKLLKPSIASDDGGFSLQLSELPAYLKQLEETMTLAETVKLYWISDVVERID